MTQVNLPKDSVRLQLYKIYIFLTTFILYCFSLLQLVQSKRSWPAACAERAAGATAGAHTGHRGGHWRGLGRLQVYGQQRGRRGQR